MLKNTFIATLTLMIFSSSALADTKDLSSKIQQIISSKKAVVGVSIYGIETKESLNINNEKHYPLESVFKFHIALTILDMVDQGRLTLEKKIYIKKSDLLPNTWSPLRDKYPKGNVKLPVSELIKYSIQESDNNACDILLKLIGGADVVNDYINKIGINDTSIKVNEEDMHKNWDNQFKNWTKPSASTDLLKIFYERKILSKKSHDYLMDVMLGTTTGTNRIKKQLPKGSLLAHKTGTSDTNKGITAGINDIGIVTLPNKKHFAISVYVTESKENANTNEKIISDIAKVTSDYFMGKK